ncbi:MAG: sigma-70 family RNA polymerase sigma factor [Actinomycetota bacterium]|nr:sigma-70 family RNA polymerase sigma factor [Actinomycetota bacterium]
MDQAGSGGPGRLSDAELVRRAARIDPGAFAALYDRHSVAAFSLARRMVGAARAEDVVQEAFLSVWRAAKRYDPGRGPVRPWLLGIVRNRSIDELRRLGVHERRRVEAEGLEDRFAARDSTDGEVLRADQSTSVRRALAALPEDQRRVLELAYFNGWTQTQIADRLGLPLGTVKGRARLALDKLRSALDPSLHAPG